MFKRKTTEAQLLELQKENKLVKAQVEKNRADLDYLSMMLDIPLEEEEDESV